MATSETAVGTLRVYSSPENVWKFLCGIFFTALLTLIVAYPRDAVTRADMELYKKDQNAVTEQIRHEMAERDTRLQEQVRQLQVDTGRIAERIGVTAHPGGNR